MTTRSTSWKGQSGFSPTSKYCCRAGVGVGVQSADRLAGVLRDLDGPELPAVRVQVVGDLGVDVALAAVDVVLPGLGFLIVVLRDPGVLGLFVRLRLLCVLDHLPFVVDGFHGGLRRLAVELRVRELLGRTAGVVQDVEE
jgi:hypothetical protein